jgi:hypothetical protein
VLSIGSLGSILSIGSRGARRGTVSRARNGRVHVIATAGALRRIRARRTGAGPRRWGDGLRSLEWRRAG